MVALVVLVGALGRWWTLIPVMALHFAGTPTVLMTVITGRVRGLPGHDAHERGVVRAWSAMARVCSVLDLDG